MAEMKTIKLYGHLGKRFGRQFRLAVDSPSEAIRALCAVLPDFRVYIAENALPGYRILVGDEARDEGNLGDRASGVIKIIPVIAGAKDAVGQILTGAALIALVYATGGMAGAGFSLMGTSALSTATLSIGWAMALGGVAQMLSPQPGVGMQSPNGSSDLPSYTFGSPTVTVGQGRPVPVFYGGPLRIGGAVVSAGIDAEEFQAKGFGGAAPDDIGTMGGNGDTAPWVWSIAPQG